MRLDVWLVGFNAGIAPAKVLASTFGLDLQEALMLELTLPTIVGRDLSEGDAESAVRALRGIGGKAEARAFDATAPLGFDLPFERHEAVRASSLPSPAVEESAPDSEPPPADDEPSIDALPSLPTARRIRQPSEGALDLRPPASRPSRERPDKIIYDNPAPPLELVDVERPKAVAQRPGQAQAPQRRSRGVTPMLPAIAALAVAAGAAFFTLRRGKTALLGTADLMGHALDAAALACLALALIFGFAAMFSDRDHLNMTPGALALVVAAGAAFLLNEWRIPTVGPDSELGGAASGLITQSQVSLAGIDSASARSLLNELRDAGAISIRGAAPVSFLGAQAFHALAIELPPGPSSRARIIETFRSAMAPVGGSASPDPAPNQSVWVVAL